MTIGFKEGAILLVIIILGVYVADMWTLKAIEAKEERDRLRAIAAQTPVAGTTTV